MQKDVFLCHSSRDRALAGEVCRVLESNELRCWIAPRDIDPGASWAGVIRTAIRESQALLVCLSEHANASEDVRREVQLARDFKVDLYCVRLADVQPQGDLAYHLSVIQMHDAFLEPRAPALDELAASLVKRIRRSPTPEERLAHMQGVLDTLVEPRAVDLEVASAYLSGRFDIAHAIHPCEDYGGDYVDFIPLRAGLAVLAVGDVSGHGTTASMALIAARASLRALLLSSSEDEYTDLSRVMEKLNLVLTQTYTDAMFLTLSLCLLDAAERTLTWCGAGVSPPVVRRGSGTIKELEHGGMALAIDEDARFAPSRALPLEPGDVLLVHTDGLPETRNAAGALWGDETVIERLAHHAGVCETSREIVEGLLADQAAFRAEEPLWDDSSVVVVRCLA